MQTTKLFELLAVAVAFASADYGASAQTSDSIDTSKQMPADTSSVSSTTDAFQPDKMRSLRTVDATAARIGEERASSPTAAAGIAKGKAAAETVLEATASKPLAGALWGEVTAVKKPALEKFNNVKEPAPQGKTPVDLIDWPRKAEIMAKILPYLENNIPFNLLENFPLVSEQRFIQGVAEFMDETKVPEMKTKIQHLVKDESNEAEILFSLLPNEAQVEEAKYSVILYFTRLWTHEKVRKMVFDLLDRGFTEEEMLLAMQQAEGGALMPGAENRLKGFYDEWVGTKMKGSYIRNWDTTATR